MEKKIRYTLGKNERLKSRKAIEQLFKEGKSFSVFPFRVVYMILTTDDGRRTTDNALLQAGFSVSSRNFKKAVDRNRIKRLTREAYRLQKNDLLQKVIAANTNLNVFFIYTGNEIPEYAFVFTKIAKALKQLQKLLNENSVANT